MCLTEQRRRWQKTFEERMRKLPRVKRLRVGLPIVPGSSLVRDYCRECQRRMNVSRVTYNPLCEECQPSHPHPGLGRPDVVWHGSLWLADYQYHAWHRRSDTYAKDNK